MPGRSQRAGASSLTWEPVIVEVPQAGDALPEVCVVGAVTAEGQLLLQGSLGNRMENKMENKKQDHKTRASNTTPEHIHQEETPGRVTGTNVSLLVQKGSLSPVQPEGLP